MTTKKLLKIKDLKSPKGHMLLGHLSQFNKGAKHQVLEEWIAECGDLFKINFVGKEFLVSANPEFNKEILKQRPNKFKRFSKMAEVIEEMGVLGAFNAEGETWKKHRRPITEALSLKKVKGYYPIILSNIDKLLSKCENYIDKQELVDVQKEFMYFTIDNTTEIAFGYPAKMIENGGGEFQEKLERIFPMINNRITAPFPYWRYFKLKQDKKLDQSLQAIEQLIYRFINEANERIQDNPELKENPSNFLEALLVEKGENKLDEKAIFSNVFTILFAGEDTTANSIAWTVFHLAQHPEIVQKIREEANSVYEDQSTVSNHTHYDQLTYTKAVAEEAIRLKPTTPQLYMEAVEDVTIQNLFIPKGTKIITQIKAGQVSEEYFTNAQEFKPERWQKGGCPMHQNHTPDNIQTFGAGPRFCPGKYLAMIEITLLISSLCKKFDFQLKGKPEEVKEAFDFTMHPENLWIEFKKVTR